MTTPKELTSLSYRQIQLRCKELGVFPLTGTRNALQKRLETYLAQRESQGPWEAKFAIEQSELYGAIRLIINTMPDLRELAKAQSDTIRAQIGPWTQDARWKMLYDDLTTVDQFDDAKQLLDRFNSQEAVDKPLEPVVNETVRIFIERYTALCWLLVRTHRVVRLLFIVNGYIEWLNDEKLVKKICIAERLSYVYYLRDPVILQCLLDNMTKKGLKMISLYNAIRYYHNEPLVITLLQKGVDIDGKEDDIANLGSKSVLEALTETPSGATRLKTEIINIHLPHFTDEAFAYFIAQHTILGQLDNVNTLYYVAQIGEEKSSLLRTYLIEVIKKNGLDEGGRLFGSIDLSIGQIVLNRALKYNNAALAIELMEYGHDPRVNLRTKSPLDASIVGLTIPLKTASFCPDALRYIVEHYDLTKEEVYFLVCFASKDNIYVTLNLLEHFPNIEQVLRAVMINEYDGPKHEIMRTWLDNYRLVRGLSDDD